MLHGQKSVAPEMLYCYRPGTPIEWRIAAGLEPRRTKLK